MIFFTFHYRKAGKIDIKTSDPEMKTDLKVKRFKLFFLFKCFLCGITLSLCPHRASLKNMPDHGGIRTYDL